MQKLKLRRAVWQEAEGENIVQAEVIKSEMFWIWHRTKAERLVTYLENLEELEAMLAYVRANDFDLQQ